MKLRTKFVSVFVANFALTLIGITTLSRRVVETVITQEVAKRLLVSAKDRAQTPALLAGFRGGDENTLWVQLKDIQERLGALSAAALDNRGKVLAHTDLMEKNKVYNDRDMLDALASSEPGYVRVQRSGAPYIRVFIPIYEAKPKATGEEFLLEGEKPLDAHSRLGVVDILAPLEGPLATSRKVSKEIFAVVAAVGILSLGLVIFSLQSLLTPIRLLSVAVGRIGRGKVGETVPVVSRDEVGDLALRFNEMSGRLAKTTVSKEYVDGIFDQMLDALIVTDMDGTVERVNPAVGEMLGASPLELTGRSVKSFFADDSLLKGREWSKVVTVGWAHNVETSFSHKNGDKIPVLFSASLLKDDEGRNLGIVGVAKNMTERKKLESRMLQSEKLSAVGQLAAGVAHEINNPLGIILGFTQSAMKRVETGHPLSLPLQSIEREAVRCRNLVKDLLTYSRASFFEKEIVDFSQVLEGALALIRPRAKVAQVEIRLKSSAGLPKILGNKNQLQQVVINLCNNAIDAMSAGGVLSVETDSLAEGGRTWLRAKVSDTGSGISPHVLSRIFEPFFTTKPVGKGTGLGLSLVHEIVTKHSGHIEVQSRPGTTEFTVRFPAHA